MCTSVICILDSDIKSPENGLGFVLDTVEDTADTIVDTVDTVEADFSFFGAADIDADLLDFFFFGAFDIVDKDWPAQNKHFGTFFQFYFTS